MPVFLLFMKPPALKNLLLTSWIFEG